MTETKKPRTPEEQWEAVLLQAAGPEARELDEMSDEEVDAELRKSGIDPERLAKEGGASVSESASAAVPVQAQPADVIAFPAVARRRPRWPLLLVAAALATAAISTGVVIATRDTPPPRPIDELELPPLERPEPAPHNELAIELREKARTDYDNGALLDCLQKLDQARALDPAGEALPAIQHLRENVKARMAALDAGPDERKRDPRKVK